MPRKLRLLPLLAALGACTYSEAEMERRPAEWTAEYPVPWKEMAGCLGLGMARQPFQVTPDIHPAENRARLMIEQQNPFGRDHLFAIFDVKGIGERTEVTWRRRPEAFRGWQARAREVADRCGRSGGTSSNLIGTRQDRGHQQ